jgi:phosphate acetyltransferase
VSRTIMLIPTGTSVDLTSVSLGAIRAMEQKGVRLSLQIYCPVDTPDQITSIIHANSTILAAAHEPR